MKQLIKIFIQRLSFIGIDDTIPSNETRQIVLTNILSSITFVLSLSALPSLSYHIKSDHRFFLWLHVLYACLWLLIPFFNGIKRYLLASLVFNLISLIFTTLFSIIVGKDSYYYLFYPLVTIAAFFIYPKKYYKYMYSIILLSSILLPTVFIYLTRNTALVMVDQRLLEILQINVIIYVSFYITLFSYYTFVIINRAEANLEAEHQKSKNLLYNILPKKIAERLKTESKIIADRFPNASVLFADIVGFTELSSKTSPEYLVQTLNSIFSVFDDMVEEYGLEKIKTIGDAYMVAAGIPEPRTDHAAVIMEFAIAMTEELRKYNDKNQTSLNMRIGINSGSVVAGVIGKRKFTYDLWGNSVNIASRMESHGVTGKIQVTKETYLLLKDIYQFKTRGTIEVKGKGPMETFILTGKKN